MAEPHSGYNHGTKIPDFLTAMVAGSYNIHNVSRNLSQLSDPKHGWTDHGPAHAQRRTKTDVGQNIYASLSLTDTSSPGSGDIHGSAYHPYLALSQCCLPPDTSPSDAAFLASFYPGADPTDSILGRCSTPDVVQAALQLDDGHVSPICKMDAASDCAVSPQVDSPSTWRSPGGREYMDSGYISEDSLPACIYQTKPAHVPSASTNKIPAFAPTFFPIVSPKSLVHVTPDSRHKDFNASRTKLDTSSKRQVASAARLGSHDLAKYEPISPVQVARVTSELRVQSALVSTSEDGPRPGEIREAKSVKRKHAETSPSDGDTTCSSHASKRGRHNEPLQQKAVLFMTEWYDAHKDNPYPSKDDKIKMATQGGINVSQVKSWFANKRNRSNNTRPKVQKQQLQDRLLTLCHTLSKDRQHHMDNSFVIQQLSTLISTSRCGEATLTGHSVSANSH